MSFVLPYLQSITEQESDQRNRKKKTFIRQQVELLH